MKKHSGENKLRLILFVIVALLHACLLFFVAFQIEKAPEEREEPANLISLVDIQEDIPPPPPREPPPEIFTNTTESIAETMIETDEEPPDIVYENVIPAAAQEEVIEYVSMSRVTDLPRLPEDQIRRAVVYPSIARDSNIEGSVILELFVDRNGLIQQVRIMLEEPKDRGFGEAALKAFTGKRGTPAYANGEAVSARYRYPVSFKIR